MLFVVDMQNEYIDKKGCRYMEGVEQIVHGIIEKIEEYEKKGDVIFYTIDLNLKNIIVNNLDIINNNDKISTIVGMMESNSKDKWRFTPYGSLNSSLENHERIEKSYYAIPPERLVEIQKRFTTKLDIINTIEFVGVETNICVLANAVCLQSTFPDAKIIINSKLCRSKRKTDHFKALEIMETMGMVII